MSSRSLNFMKLSHGTFQVHFNSYQHCLASRLNIIRWICHNIQVCMHGNGGLPFVTFCMQSFLESDVKEILSNGFSSHQDKRGKNEEGDRAEQQLLGTGRPRAHLVMFTHLITE